MLAGLSAGSSTTTGLPGVLRALVGEPQGLSATVGTLTPRVQYTYSGDDDPGVSYDGDDAPAFTYPGGGVASYDGDLNPTATYGA